jgi:hypothetical protein
LGNLDCSGHGTCRMNGRCRCEQGFHGAHCASTICKGSYSLDQDSGVLAQGWYDDSEEDRVCYLFLCGWVGCVSVCVTLNLVAFYFCLP